MNQAQGLATLYLLKDTDMNEEEFKQVFHKDNIIGIDPINVRLSNGSVHKFHVADILNLMSIDSFETNETEEKATDTKISDKIAM